MSENFTAETLVDESAEVLDEDDSYSWYINSYLIIYYFDICYTTLLIVVGIPCNILALLLLVRRHLWHQHEAYIYVAVILIFNTLKLFLFDSNRWMELINRSIVRIPTIADIACKFWQWCSLTISCINWLHVLMLLNVYLRQQLMTSNDRRGYFMNLAAKYCSLFGTKVIVISFFTFCAVGNFWVFSLFSLERQNGIWYCMVIMTCFPQCQPMLEASWWLRSGIPFVLAMPLVFLVVWRINRRSGSTLINTNGVSEEAMAKIALLCATAVFILIAPTFLVHFLYTYNSNYRTIPLLVFQAVRLISFAYPLSTPIVCFTVKSRFRDELRTMIEVWCCRPCWPGTRCNRTLSREVADNGSSVLQMDPIEEDLSITENKEEPDLPNRTDT